MLNTIKRHISENRRMASRVCYCFRVCCQQERFSLCQLYIISVNYQTAIQHIKPIWNLDNPLYKKMYNGKSVPGNGADLAEKIGAAF